MQDVMSYKVAKQQYWRNNSLREATMGLQNPKASARRQTSKVTWRSRPTAQSNHINFPTQTRAQHPLCPDIWPENANVPKELRAQTHQAATWRQSMRFTSTELPENINAWRQQLKTNFTKWILNSSARPTVEWSEHDPRQSHNRCAAISDDVYWWFLRSLLYPALLYCTLLDSTLPYSALLLKILKPFSALLFSTLLLTNLTLGF